MHLRIFFFMMLYAENYEIIWVGNMGGWAQTFILILVGIENIY